MYALKADSLMRRARIRELDMKEPRRKREKSIRDARTERREEPHSKLVGTSRLEPRQTISREMVPLTKIQT